MKKLILALIFSFSAQAEVLNYKNINALAGILCEKAQSAGGKKLHSYFKIDKEEVAPGQYRVQLSGSCNNKIAGNKIDELGEEISIEFNSNSRKASGTLGIKTVEIILSNKGFSTVTVTDPLFNQTKKVNLKNSQWAANNMIFSSSPMKIKTSRKIAAVEKAGVLNLRNQIQYYDIWNYETYGCSVDISPTQCEALEI